MWHGLTCSFAGGVYDPPSGVVCRSATDTDRRSATGWFETPINAAAIAPAVDEIIRLLEEADV